MQDVFAKRDFKSREYEFDLVVFCGYRPAAQFVNSSFQGQDGTPTINAITTIKMVLP